MQRQLIVRVPRYAQAASDTTEIVTEKIPQVTDMTEEGAPQTRDEWNGEDPEREAEVEAGRKGSEVIASKVGQKVDGRHGERDCGDGAEEQQVLFEAQTDKVY